MPSDELKCKVRRLNFELKFAKLWSGWPYVIPLFSSLDLFYFLPYTVWTLVYTVLLAIYLSYQIFFTFLSLNSTQIQIPIIINQGFGCIPLYIHILLRCNFHRNGSVNRGHTHGTSLRNHPRRWEYWYYHTGSDSSDEQLSSALAAINLERRTWNWFSIKLLCLLPY